MSMFYCHYTFEASQHPKFYDEALHMLTRAKNKAFMAKVDVRALADLVRQRLEEDKPKNSPAHLDVSVSTDGSIQMTLSSGRDTDTDIGRAWFSPIKAFWSYDPYKGYFIGVKIQREEERSCQADVRSGALEQKEGEV